VRRIRHPRRISLCSLRNARSAKVSPVLDRAIIRYLLSRYVPQLWPVIFHLFVRHALTATEDRQIAVHNAVSQSRRIIWLWYFDARLMRLRGPTAVNRPPKCQRNPPLEIISKILDHTGIFNISFAFVELCRIKRAECHSGCSLIFRIIPPICYLMLLSDCSCLISGL
jgi:hypothetical protein